MSCVCVEPEVEMPSAFITVAGFTCTAPAEVSSLNTFNGVL